MAFTCNINPKGQALRFLLGFALFFLATICFVIDFPGRTVPWRIFQVGMILLSVFLMLEGILGWCALRALGFKTRI